MESDIGFACAVGNALVAGKDIKELLELQVSLQLVLSIVNGAIAKARLASDALIKAQSAPIG